MRSSREITMSSAAPAFSTPPPEKVEEQKAEARARDLATGSDTSALPSIELSPRDREVLFSAILNPPSPNKHLRAAAKKYFRRIHA
jgi:hypothetical protein